MASTPAESATPAGTGTDDVSPPSQTRQRLPTPVRVVGAGSDFDVKYPFDIYGEESAPDARVWSVYRDHMPQNDTMRINRWNKTLDILLIFAGLFSAVVTTFIGESYQQLQPDWNEYNARLMFAIVDAQRTPGKPPVLPNLPGMSPPSFTAPRLSLCVNALWVLVLVLNLSVALMAILAKQWLIQYDARVSSTLTVPRDWALWHFFHAAGLQTWHVGTIIDTLPVVLHLALILFLAGLAQFFWTLHVAIASGVVLLTACLTLFYLSTIILTFKFPACPYHIGWFESVHWTFSFILDACGMRSPLSAAHVIKNGMDSLVIQTLTAMFAAVAPTDVGLVAINALGSLLEQRAIGTTIGQEHALERIALSQKFDRLFDRGDHTIRHRPYDELITDRGDLTPLSYGYLCLVRARVYLLQFQQDFTAKGILAQHIIQHNCGELEGTCVYSVLRCVTAILLRNTEIVWESLEQLAGSLVAGKGNLSLGHIAQLMRMLTRSDLSPPLSAVLDLMPSPITAAETPVLEDHFILLTRALRPELPAVFSIDRPFSHLFMVYCDIITCSQTALRDVDMVLCRIVDLARMSYRQRGSYTPFQPSVDSFMATHISLRAPWDRYSLASVMEALCFSRVSEHAMVHTALAMVRLGDLSALLQSFDDLVFQNTAEHLVLLRRFVCNNGASTWRTLCCAIVAQSTDAEHLLRLIRMAETLATELRRKRNLADCPVLTEELFSEDIVTPALRLSTGHDYDRLKQEAHVAKFLCTSLPTMAPHLWVAYRDRVHAHASTEVRRSSFWPVFLEADTGADASCTTTSTSGIVLNANRANSPGEHFGESSLPLPQSDLPAELATSGIS